jgi:hypothetical protein
MQNRFDVVKFQLFHETEKCKIMFGYDLRNKKQAKFHLTSFHKTENTIKSKIYSKKEVRIVAGMSV